MSNIVNCTFVILFVCWTLILLKLIFGKLFAVKTVKAEVIDKYKTLPVSKYPTTQGEKMFVVFKTDKKKLLFEISEFTYGEYCLGDKGVLKYKGRHLISFV